MADISIQFHALQEEVTNFAAEVVRDFGVNLIAMQFRPFAFKRVDQNSIRDFLATEPTFRRWAFLLGEAVLPVAHELDFANRNPDHLRLDVGVLTGKGLAQSWLSARAQDPSAIGLWKKIAARLKRMTQAGVIAMNPKTGATCHIKSFRYTAAAKALFQRGTAMLPPAGTAALKFD